MGSWAFNGPPKFPFSTVPCQMREACRYVQYWSVKASELWSLGQRVTAVSMRCDAHPLLPNSMQSGVVCRRRYLDKAIPSTFPVHLDAIPLDQVYITRRDILQGHKSAIFVLKCIVSV